MQTSEQNRRTFKDKNSLLAPYNTVAPPRGEVLRLFKPRLHEEDMTTSNRFVNEYNKRHVKRKREKVCGNEWKRLNDNLNSNALTT